jgi:hypothetical protein
MEGFMGSRLVTCRDCGEEISKNADSCPHCGARQKRRYGRRGGCLGFLAVIAIVVGIIWAVSDGAKAVSNNSLSSQEKDTESKTNSIPTEKDYEDTAPMLDFRKAAFEEYEKGQMLRFKAQAWLIVGKRVTVNTKKDDVWGYTEDTAYLDFESTPEILVNDIMWVYGKYNGIMNIAGNRFPIINVDHFGVVDN